FVAFSSTDAHIGGIRYDGQRVRVCDLGGPGCGQSYVGIAALSWSDELLPKSSNDTAHSNSKRIATFFLKTDGGDLLTAVAIKPAGTATVDPTDCRVFKDMNLQQDEY